MPLTVLLIGLLASGSADAAERLAAVHAAPLPALALPAEGQPPLMINVASPELMPRIADLTPHVQAEIRLQAAGISYGERLALKAAQRRAHAEGRWADHRRLWRDADEIDARDGLQWLPPPAAEHASRILYDERGLVKGLSFSERAFRRFMA